MAWISSLFLDPVEREYIPNLVIGYAGSYTVDTTTIVYRRENIWINPKTLVSLHYDRHPDSLSRKYTSYLDDTGYILKEDRVDPISESLISERTFDYSDGKIQTVTVSNCCTTNYLYSGNTVDSIFTTSDGSGYDAYKFAYDTDGRLVLEKNYYKDLGEPISKFTKYEYFLPDSVTSLKTNDLDSSVSTYSVFYFEKDKLIKKISYSRSPQINYSNTTLFKYASSNSILKRKKPKHPASKKTTVYFGMYNILGKLLYGYPK